MTPPPDVGHAGLVARTELRRTWRNLRGTTRGTILLVGAGLVLPMYGFGLGVAAYFLGGELAGGGFTVGRTIVGASLAGIAALVMATVLQRAIKQTGEPDGADGLLTTVPYREVLAGLLLAEFGRIAVVVSLPLLGVAAGFALGTGSVLAAVVLLALLAALALVGLEAGYALGLVAKWVAGRSEFVARHRAAIGVLLSIGIPVAYISLNTVPAVQRAVVGLVASSPLAWFADVVYLVVPGATARPLPAVGGILSPLVAVPLLAALVDRLADRVWYMDRVEPAHEFDPEATTLSDRLLAGKVPRGTQVVVQKSWRRARRAPFTVQFAVFPFVLLVFQLQTALVNRTVPPSLPLLVALASGAAGGAAFTLNPLGGEGDVLPTTLTAKISGRQFVGGLALAGAIPGMALVVGLSLPLGVVAGLSPVDLAGVLATGLVVAAGAPAVASGVGVVFPRFETTSVRDHEVVVPSSWAFAGYVVVLGVALVPALVTQHPVLSSLLSAFLPVTGSTLIAAGVLSTALALVVLGGASAGYATWTVGRYRLD